MFIASAWNPKASKWVKGRKNQFAKINQKSGKNQLSTVWMHCASLGEFEQGRPLLEQIRIQFPQKKIVLTFFSPSGYEVMKHYEGADVIAYLPLDTASNAKVFIELLSPELVLWVKYEFWYHFLAELHKKDIPVLLVSGIFRKKQLFFRSFGWLWKRMLNRFSHFFLQDTSSALLLESIGQKNITISGDTRFDRVVSISESREDVKGIPEFCNSNKVIVAGSTWEEDEILLIHYLKVNASVKLIIAPHEIYPENLQNVKSSFPKSIFYSEWIGLINKVGNASTGADYNCLIIDNIGMLSALYRYGDVCYVGGGFGIEGVHNVLEAAVYGKPVLFGPEYEKYLEAVELIDCGGADEVKNAVDLERVFDMLLNNESKRIKWGLNSKEYVLSKTGATKIIMDHIYMKRLLTN